MKQLYFKSSKDWRKWLKNNYEKEIEVWLIFYKKESGYPTIEYEFAVEEALCYGWIDSVIKKIDNIRYARKFTPRRNNSKWSEVNKTRTAKLIKDNRMTKIGLAKIDIAKRNGQWDKPDRPDIEFHIPREFQEALNQNIKANKNFEQLTKSYQKQYIGWIIIAKRQETKEKRIKEATILLENNKKLGLK